jgi:hypothetical protein
MGTHRRGSNSESGMRLLRRLEKNECVPPFTHEAAQSFEGLSL